MSKLQKMDSERKEKKEKIAHDEYEAMAIILQENPGLKKRVLNKIKEIRALSKETISDVVNKNKNSIRDRARSETE